MVLTTFVQCLRRADIKDMQDERREVTADCGVWQRLEQNVD